MRRPYSCSLALLIAAVGMIGCGATGPNESQFFSISLSVAQAAQGERVPFTLYLPEDAQEGGMPLVLSLGGVGVGADTVILPPDASGSAFILAVPNAAGDGALIIRASLPTLHHTTSASLQIKDTVPPVFTFGTINSGIPGESILIAGTTDTVALSAYDNHKLAWIGWSLNGYAPLADSVFVTSESASVNLPIRVPVSLIGDTLGLSVFVTDSDGNRTSAAFPGLLVASLNTHPMLFAPRGGRVMDVAFDTTRGLLYLAKPDSQIVSVLAAAGMKYETPIQVTGMPVSVDLTPGGDSLIVGLASPPSIAIVNIASPGRPVIATLRIDSVAVPDTLWALRVASDNRVIAVVTHYGNYTTGADLELNLGSGARQTIDSSTFGCTAPPIASVDRTHLLLINCPSPNGGGSTLYLSATHTYSGTGFFDFGGAGNNWFTAASQSGSVYQFEHILLDSTVTQVFGPGADIRYGAAVAPNGQDFFLAGDFCLFVSHCLDSIPGLYVRYIYPDARPVEVVLTPRPAFELTVSPTSRTLVGIAADTIIAVDLTKSTPPSSELVAQVRHLLRAIPLRVRGGAGEIHPSSQNFRIYFNGRALPPIPVATGAATSLELASPLVPIGTDDLSGVRSGERSRGRSVRETIELTRFFTRFFGQSPTSYGNESGADARFP